ncbi:hypothetical protein M011DRAFT_196424 [Sporormia fimetaria CBS 119925]|uniref:Uncharacterized protein n=1 Tax=Sporormia fimetaria CBS 119925 TaxID=1340428 RepID=A0A6A6V398_9PLEO|nr:hypothetical protein M011DRAFT_196424 [Sporormia fimetaria CBS 119925]
MVRCKIRLPELLGFTGLVHTTAEIGFQNYFFSPEDYVLFRVRTHDSSRQWAIDLTGASHECLSPAVEWNTYKERCIERLDGIESLQFFQHWAEESTNDHPLLPTLYWRARLALIKYARERGSPISKLIDGSPATIPDMMNTIIARIHSSFLAIIDNDDAQDRYKAWVEKQGAGVMHTFLNGFGRNPSKNWQKITGRVYHEASPRPRQDGEPLRRDTSDGNTAPDNTPPTAPSRRDNQEAAQCEETREETSADHERNKRHGERHKTIMSPAGEGTTTGNIVDFGSPSETSENSSTDTIGVLTPTGETSQETAQGAATATQKAVEPWPKRFDQTREKLLAEFKDIDKRRELYDFCVSEKAIEEAYRFSREELAFELEETQRCTDIQESIRSELAVYFMQYIGFLVKRDGTTYQKYCALEEFLDLKRDPKSVASEETSTVARNSAQMPAHNTPDARETNRKPWPENYEKWRVKFFTTVPLSLRRSFSEACKINKTAEKAIGWTTAEVDSAFDRVAESMDPSVHPHLRCWIYFTKFFMAVENRGLSIEEQYRLLEEYLDIKQESLVKDEAMTENWRQLGDSFAGEISKMRSEGKPGQTTNVTETLKTSKQDHSEELPEKSIVVEKTPRLWPED